MSLIVLMYILFVALAGLFFYFIIKAAVKEAIKEAVMELKESPIL